ncbi:MAG: exodeoxyribonuclease VII large subunit, partial [Candidatus Omnitrophica bacterium]|nr:exodeoxyribonuclease VII large subunit [Candidatus Omnitrophota bacterium]
VLTAGHLVELNVRTFESAHKKLMVLNPVSRLEQYPQDVENVRKQIVVRMGHLLALKDAGFKGILEKLAGLSPLNILARGYSITFKLPEEAVLKDAAAVRKGDLLRTRLHRGEIISQVTEV